MNYVLLLVILGLCGGGYYEYQQLQQAQQVKDSAYEKQLAELQAQNQSLSDAQKQLTTEDKATKAQVAALTGQLKTAANDLASAKAAAAPVTAGSAQAAPGVPSTATLTNNLGTIATLGGQTYQNCQLLKVDADGITVGETAGITKIPFALLPPNLQQRFGYDPHVALALTVAQIAFLEEQRKAAATAPKPTPTP